MQVKNQENDCYNLAKTVTGPRWEHFGNHIDATAPAKGTDNGCDQGMPWTVYNRQGQRKYLTRSETKSFLDAARNREPAVQSFCWMLAVTGCRISEALALSGKSIDFEAKHVVIECLKKRGKRIFRAVPLPTKLLDRLQTLMASGILNGERLWPWSRMTGYRRICEVMRAAGVTGSYATPKGLRHGFGVRAIQSNVPLNLVQRWLGHANIKTTAIYTSAMGPEEREIAARMWIDSQELPKPARTTRIKRASMISDDPKLEPTKRRGPGRKSVTDSNGIGPPEAPISSYKVPSLFDKIKSSCSLLQFWLFGNSARRIDRHGAGG
jgi:hypothetical protein